MYIRSRQSLSRISPFGTGLLPSVMLIQKVSNEMCNYYKCQQNTFSRIARLFRQRGEMVFTGALCRSTFLINRQYYASASQPFRFDFLPGWKLWPFLFQILSQKLTIYISIYFFPMLDWRRKLNPCSCYIFGADPRFWQKVLGWVLTTWKWRFKARSLKEG